MWRMRSFQLVLLLVTASRVANSKATPAVTHAYATPTPQKTPELEVPQMILAQEVVANTSAPEHTAAAEDVIVQEEGAEEDEDPRIALAKNPIVQIAKHISHGILDDYVCKHSYSVEIVRRDPLVLYLHGFLQPGEAEHMIVEGAKVMARSLVAHSESNSTSQANKKDEQRTSSSAFMNRGQDAVMTCIEQRAADIVGEDRDHLEGLQVVWYQKNQKYNPHFDYFPKSTEYYQAYTANGGQRTYTFFIYLTDVTYDVETGERVELEGGETSFPTLGLSFPPVKGAAVFWTNMNIDGSEDERVLHGGDPVIRGQKMAINVWFREKAFNV